VPGGVDLRGCKPPSPGEIFGGLVCGRAHPILGVLPSQSRPVRLAAKMKELPKGQWLAEALGRWGARGVDDPQGDPALRYRGPGPTADYWFAIPPSEIMCLPDSLLRLGCDWRRWRLLVGGSNRSLVITTIRGSLRLEIAGSGRV